MEKLKVGIIGCGNIFPMHAKSIEMTNMADVVAVCDIIEEKAKRRSASYKCKYYTDYKKMISENKLDVVHICTPHFLHHSMAIYLANEKINVVTEKPMALNHQLANGMVKEFEKNDVCLGVIFQNRYNPGSKLVKKALLSGKLGNIISCRLLITWKRTDEYYESTNWKGTWDKEGGGVIIDQAIHSLDLIRWFVDEEIEYVESNMGTRQHDKIEVEDYAEGYIKFKGGIFASFYTINYHSYDAPIELEIYCENGCAKIIGDTAQIKYNNGMEEHADVDEKEFIDFGEGAKSYWGTSHSKQIDEYYTRLLKREKIEIDGKEALKTQKMIDAIYQSGKTKSRVYL